MCIVCNPGLFSFLKQGTQTRRQFFRTGAALASAAVLSTEAGVKPSQTPSSEAGADAIFHGSIITMNEVQPNAEAVAVRAGRIVAVGSLEELETGSPRFQCNK